MAELAGSSAAALALLPLLQNDYARAATVAADDARLAVDTVSFDVARRARSRGYLARLKVKAQTAGRASSSTRTAGLTRTSRTSRGASRSKAFSRLRPTCFRLPGGTPADEDKARDLHRQGRQERDARAALRGGRRS